MLIDLLLRWTHVLSAVALLGGSFFLRWTVVPALSTLAEEPRQALQQAMRRRWAGVVGVASGLLLISGLVNAVLMIKRYEFIGPLSGMYHMLVGVKLLLAFGVFTLAALLSGRSAAAERMRGQHTFWLNVTVALGVTLVCLGGLMKMIDRDAKPPATTELASRVHVEP